MQFARPFGFRPWMLASVVIVTISGVFFILAGGWLGHQRETDGWDHAPGFRDVALQSGLTFKMNFLSAEQGENYRTSLYDHGCGVAVADFDGDGFEDIYFCSQLGMNALYRNKGDGTFENVAQQAGVALGDRICVAATWADFDNDGLPDLFVTSTRGGNVLFKNLGNGTFKDVTEQAGLTYVGHSQTAVFFDYDNDGWLDLLVLNTAKWTEENRDATGRFFPSKYAVFELMSSPPEFNILYHNNRDGTFTNVTDKAGLKGKGWSADAAVFDYNEDGWLDVVVTNMFGRSQLYRNNGNGTFTDVTDQTLRRTSWGAVGAKAFDFNNDGKFDLFIVDMHSDMWLTVSSEHPIIVDTMKYRDALGPYPPSSPQMRKLEESFANRFKIKYDQVLFGNTFFKNLGGGKFEEISDKAGLETFWPWSIATGDFDNDGYEDIFIGSGMGYPFFYWRNYLMMNNGDETFTDHSRTSGIEPPARGIYSEDRIAGKLPSRSSRTAAIADFDNDGRLEIVTNNFNDHPYLFKNNFPHNNYVAFKLQGTRSNRDAIGAVVKLHTGKEVMARQVSTAGGYLSHSSKTVHFGLGNRSHIDSVEIRWPSGKVQKIDHPDMNRLHHILEPQEESGKAPG